MLTLQKEPESVQMLIVGSVNRLPDSVGAQVQKSGPIAETVPCTALQKPQWRSQGKLSCATSSTTSLKTARACRHSRPQARDKTAAMKCDAYDRYGMKLYTYDGIVSFAILKIALHSCCTAIVQRTEQHTMNKLLEIISSLIVHGSYRISASMALDASSGALPLSTCFWCTEVVGCNESSLGCG